MTITEWMLIPMANIPNIAGVAQVINASDIGLSWGLIPEVTNTLAAVWFELTAITGNPSMDIRIETDDGVSNRPSGTLVDAHATMTQLFTAANWKRCAFATPFTLTAGEGLISHVVVAPPSSGNIPDSVTNKLTIQRGMSGTGFLYTLPENNGIAASGLTTSGGRSNLAMAFNVQPAVVLEYQDGTYYYPRLFAGVGRPISSFDVFGANYGGVKVKFQSPFMLMGVAVNIDKTGTPTALAIEVRDDNNNVVKSCTGYNPVVVQTGTFNRYLFKFNPGIIIPAGRYYRIYIKGGAADISSNKFSLLKIPVAAAGMLPFNGDFMQTTSSNSGSTWTDVTTTALSFALAGYPAASLRKGALQ